MQWPCWEHVFCPAMHMCICTHMSYSLNSLKVLKGVYLVDYNISIFLCPRGSGELVEYAVFSCV